MIDLFTYGAYIFMHKSEYLDLKIKPGIIRHDYLIESYRFF